MLSTSSSDSNVAAVLAFLNIVKQLFSTAQQDSGERQKWQRLLAWKFPARAELAGIVEGDVLQPTHPWHQQFEEFACWQKAVMRLLSSSVPVTTAVTELSPLLPVNSSPEEQQINHYVSTVRSSPLWIDFQTQHGARLRNLFLHPRLLQQTLYQIETTELSQLAFGTLQENRLLRYLLQVIVRMLSNPSVPSPLNAIPRHGKYYALLGFLVLVVCGALAGALVDQNFTAIQAVEKAAGLPVSSRATLGKEWGLSILVSDCSDATVADLAKHECDFSQNFIVYCVVALALTLPLLIWIAVTGTPGWRRGDQHKLMMQNLELAALKAEWSVNDADAELLLNKGFNSRVMDYLNDHYQLTANACLVMCRIGIQTPEQVEQLRKAGIPHEQIVLLLQDQRLPAEQIARMLYEAGFDFNRVIDLLKAAGLYTVLIGAELQQRHEVDTSRVQLQLGEDTSAGMANSSSVNFNRG